jgi:hypothetical protein
MRLLKIEIQTVGMALPKVNPACLESCGQIDPTAEKHRFPRQRRTLWFIVAELEAVNTSLPPKGNHRTRF